LPSSMYEDSPIFNLKISCLLRAILILFIYVLDSKITTFIKFMYQDIS
jgi:hypothetical protein